MTRNKTSIGLIALALAISSNAQAAADHTYVATTGADSGTTCARAAPCRNLQYAHNQTNAKGTISVLDTGDYSALTITKAITIKASAGVDATITGLDGGGGNNITVLAADSDVVVLEGLTMDGGSAGIASVVYGVGLYSGGAVYVINCTIKNDNIGVYNRSSTPNARAFVQRTNLLRNATGVRAGIINSGTPVISVLDSLIDGSTIAGADAGIGTVIGMARTVINAGATAITSAGSGQVISIGPSNIISGAGSFAATVPFN